MSGSFSSGLLDSLAHPAQVNYLDVVDKASKAALYINDARKTQAQQLAGEAFQRSINPDGTPNQTALLSNLAGAGPGAALAAQSSAQAGQTLDQDTFSTHMARLTGASNAAMALWSQHNGVVPQDAVNQEIDEQLPRLGFTPEQIAQAKTQFGPDPVANGNILLRNHAANLSAQQALLSALPPTGTQNIGGAVVGTAGNAALSGKPQGSIAPVGQPIGVGLSPDVTAQQVSVVDQRRTLPDGTENPSYGQKVTRNLGDVLREQGWSPQATGGGPATPQGAAAAPPPSPTNQPRLPAAVPSKAPPAASGGGVATSLPPGEDERLKASTDQYNTDNAASGQFQQRIFPLAQSHALLESGDVTTGPGAEAVNRIKEFLQTRATSFGWDAQTIASAKFDELNKYLTQVVNSNPFAAASDARLASAVSGNPSAHISTLANKDVIKAMIGLERMRQASIQSFKQQGLPPSTYTDFQSKFAANTDPRAFVLDMLTPEQQKTMVGTMKTPAARKAFSNGLDVVANQPALINLPAMPH